LCGLLCSTRSVARRRRPRLPSSGNRLGRGEYVIVDLVIVANQMGMCCLLVTPQQVPTELKYVPEEHGIAGH
jgi:hypothetical protein